MVSLLSVTCIVMHYAMTHESLTHGMQCGGHLKICMCNSASSKLGKIAIKICIKTCAVHHSFLVTPGKKQGRRIMIRGVEMSKKDLGLPCVREIV